jgi:hypothetical protein
MYSIAIFRLDIVVKYRIYSRWACLVGLVGHASNWLTAQDTMRDFINSSSGLCSNSSFFIFSTIDLVVILAY